ncbi:MAG: ATP-binding protein [Solirubrobacteraceae bacterium]
MIGRVSSPRFVGRREELSALGGAVAAAADGAGSVVLVTGDSGIGKSRLLAEFATGAAASGALVLIGECPPIGDGELPYAPIVGALRGIVRGGEADAPGGGPPGGRHELNRLFDVGMSVEPGESLPADGAQARLFEQLLAVLLEAAGAAPLVLIVEDLQWADSSTRAFLTFLVRAARPERFALVCSYRTDAVNGRRHSVRPFVDELVRGGRATTVSLGPLSRSEIHEQVAGILGSAPEPGLVELLHRRSEGNPFFAEELLVSSRGRSELPDSLRDSLLWRLDGKPEDVRAVLRIAAAAGRTIDHDLLATVSGLSEDDLAVALRDAVDSYVLTHSEPRSDYAFRHALLREVIYADLLPGERRRVHGELARVLSDRAERTGLAEDASELAHHWYAAGEPREALVASLEAGRSAERINAFGEALLHYERALAAWDAAGDLTLPMTRTEVTVRAAEAARLTAAYERAVALASSAVEQIDEQADPTAAALAHARLGHTLWVAGRGEDAALIETSRALALMPAEPATADRAFVLARDAQLLLRCNRPEASAARCEEALVVARAAGASAVEANVLNTSCPNLSAVGNFEAAVAAAERARAIAGSLGLVEELLRSYVNGSDALDHAGHVEDAIALAYDGIELSGQLGVERRYGDCLRGEVAGRLVELARWAEADDLLEQVLDRGPPAFIALIALEHLGRLQAERGDFELAIDTFDAAADRVRHVRSSVWTGPAVAGRATVELWAARPGRAAELVADCLERVTDHEHVFYTARLYALGVRAAADLASAAPGDARRRRDQEVIAEELIARFDRQLAKLTGSSPPRVLAIKADCAAERSRIGGDSDPDLWKEAAARWEDCGNRYLAAYANWRHAEAILGSGGDRAQAAALVRAAHAVADELGARPLRDELAACPPGPGRSGACTGGGAAAQPGTGPA